MANFWKIVNEVISKSEVVLEVLDARMVEETRNEEVESKILNSGKKLVYVINKCDLVGDFFLHRLKGKLEPAVFVSSKKRYGITILKKKILELSRGADVVVGVVGYPNTGKSSVINALGGKAKAPVSSQSGFTKALQKIRSGKITLLDTPGVIPFMEGDELKHALISAKDYSKVKDPDFVVTMLMEKFDEIERFYGIDKDEEKENSLVKIAKKRGFLLKGGEPDIIGISRKILKDWQNGTINLR